MSIKTMSNQDIMNDFSFKQGVDKNGFKVNMSLILYNNEQSEVMYHLSKQLLASLYFMCNNCNYETIEQVAKDLTKIGHQLLNNDLSYFHEYDSFLNVLGYAQVSSNSIELFLKTKHLIKALEVFFSVMTFSEHNEVFYEKMRHASEVLYAYSHTAEFSREQTLSLKLKKKLREVELLQKDIDRCELKLDELDEKMGKFDKKIIEAKSQILLEIDKSKIKELRKLIKNGPLISSHKLKLSHIFFKKSEVGVGATNDSGLHQNFKR